MAQRAPTRLIAAAVTSFLIAHTGADQGKVVYVPKADGTPDRVIWYSADPNATRSLLEWGRDSTSLVKWLAPFALTTVALTSASTSPQVLPASSTCEVYCVGEGGTGATSVAATASGAGGAGGACVFLANDAAILAGGSFAFVIGSGGTATDTNFNSSAYVAKAGPSASGVAAGTAPAASASTVPAGGTKNAGGSGGIGRGTSTRPGGGGGGAGGTTGAGAAGGAAFNGNAAGSGGGGADNGSAGAVGGANGGAGGASGLATAVGGAGGTASASPTSGTLGSGGGGGGGTGHSAGAAGSSGGTQFDGSHGAGGGGGGGAVVSGCAGGAGGSYGGGGGGAGESTGISAVGGAGAGGLIFITYTQAINVSLSGAAATGAVVSFGRSIGHTFSAVAITSVAEPFKSNPQALLSSAAATAGVAAFTPMVTPGSGSVSRINYGFVSRVGRLLGH